MCSKRHGRLATYRLSLQLAVVGGGPFNESMARACAGGRRTHRGGLCATVGRRRCSNFGELFQAGTGPTEAVLPLRESAKASYNTQRQPWDTESTFSTLGYKVALAVRDAGLRRDLGSRVIDHDSPFCTLWVNVNAR